MNKPMNNSEKAKNSKAWKKRINNYRSPLISWLKMFLNCNRSICTPKNKINNWRAIRAIILSSLEAVICRLKLWLMKLISRASEWLQLLTKLYKTVKEDYNHANICTNFSHNDQFHIICYYLWPWSHLFCKRKII